MAIKKYIYVDCTSTFFSKYNTGIQRVVRNIVGRLENYKSDQAIFIPIVYVHGSYYVLNLENNGSLFFYRFICSLARYLRSLLDIILHRSKPDTAWSVDLYTQNGASKDSLHCKLVSFFRTNLHRCQCSALIADGFISLKGKRNLTRDDTLFVVDPFWGQVVKNSIDTAERLGCKIILIVYDVIAITHENVFEDKYRANFIDKFNEISEKLYGIISISKYALSEIEKYLATQSLHLNYDYFYLGADFLTKNSEDKNIRDKLFTVFKGGPVYLIVGTLEPRKGHAFVLDAFDRLWDRNDDIRLCIVGREGWLCEAVIERLSSSTNSGKRLFYFSDLGDEELEYCYRNSAAQIIASTVEGFGLPLVEAMHFGKPVFASDIPVFREIGGEYPFYFDLAAPQTLTDAIVEFTDNRTSRSFSTKKWLTWDESVEDLLGKVILMANEKPRSKMS